MAWIARNQRAHWLNQFEICGERNAGGIAAQSLFVGRPAHLPRELCQGDDIRDRPNVDQGNAECGWQRRKRKTLHWRVDRHCCPAEMDEGPPFTADHMRIQQDRCEAKVFKVAANGCAFEFARAFNLTGAAELFITPLRSSCCAQHAQNSCVHGEGLSLQCQAGIRPGPVRETPKGPLPSAPKQEGNFHFSN